MNRQRNVWTTSALTIALSLAPVAPAAGQPPAHGETQSREQMQVYGNQLMTPQERTEYSARMRAATTAAQREQIRKEHHEQMQQRARERGVTLPDEPPPREAGIGPDHGMGPGGARGEP